MITIKLSKEKSEAIQCDACFHGLMMQSRVARAFSPRPLSIGDYKCALIIFNQ